MYKFIRKTRPRGAAPDGLYVAWILGEIKFTKSESGAVAICHPFSSSLIDPENFWLLWEAPIGAQSIYRLVRPSIVTGSTDIHFCNVGLIWRSQAFNTTYSNLRIFFVYQLADLFRVAFQPSGPYLVHSRFSARTATKLFLYGNLTDVGAELKQKRNYYAGVGNASDGRPLGSSSFLNHDGRSDGETDKRCTCICTFI